MNLSNQHASKPFGGWALRFPRPSSWLQAVGPRERRGGTERERWSEDGHRPPIFETWLHAWFLPERDHVTFGSLLSQIRLWSVSLSRAPYSGGWNFGQYFFAICALGILWPRCKILRMIVTGEPLRRGRGSKIERCHIRVSHLVSFLLTLSPPIPLRLYTLPYWSNPPFLIFDIRALEPWEQ